MNYSLPGSSVHEIIQVKILEWVIMPSSRGSFPLKGFMSFALQADSSLLSHKGSEIFHILCPNILASGTLLYFYNDTCTKLKQNTHPDCLQRRLCPVWCRSKACRVFRGAFPRAARPAPGGSPRAAGTSRANLSTWTPQAWMLTPACPPDAALSFQVISLQLPGHQLAHLR